MRRLQRPQIALPTLGEGGAGHRAASRHQETWEANPEAELNLGDHWNKPDVRGALYAMHGWICAYCQCALGRTRGDVDHFRPKSIYWWMAYDFVNFFLSCSICNQHRKGGRFPLAAGTEPIGFTERAKLRQEVRLLLDPAEDPVEDWLSTDFEDDLCRIENRCNAEKQATAWEQVDTTIRIFRLNKDLQLIKERTQIVDEALELLDEIYEAPHKRPALCRMASRFAPHGLIVRRLLEALDPDLVPALADELRWLFDDFVRGLNVVRDLLRESDEAFLRNHEAEIRWALAVLWKAPPVKTLAPTIKAWIDEAGLSDEIQPLYDQL